MFVFTQPLCIILLDAGDSGPNAFVFCINRPLNEIAETVWYLREVDGVTGMVWANRNVDDNLEDQTIIELIFDDLDDLPAVFGRIGFALAHSLEVAYEDTLLFRPIQDDNPEVTNLSSMTLPSYALKFPTTLETSSDQELPEWSVLQEMEQSLRSA